MAMEELSSEGVRICEEIAEQMKLIESGTAVCIEDMDDLASLVVNQVRVLDDLCKINFGNGRKN